MQLEKIRSNRSIFVPQNSASPKDGLFAHISGLGRLARLDFEHFNVAGEVIFRVDGDAAPTTQQDEEARIGSLAYALKKLGNGIDAAEFVRCLNAICEGGDARYRQAAASHYFREVSERGVGIVLKEMALLAMQLEQIANRNGVVVDEDVVDFGYAASACDSNTILSERAEKRLENSRSLFDREVEAVSRLVSGQRKCTGFARDDFSDWVNDLEENGAGIEELDAAFEALEAMDQYDENGAIIVMSSFERTMACGKLDSEYVEEDLLGRAKHLAGDLRRAYANGLAIEVIWEDINAELDVIFPVKGKTGDGGRFYSHANREFQTLSREILEAILGDCQADFHLTALRTNKSYRTFHKSVRGATDTKQIGEIMKRAYEARLSGALPLKHFTTLNTAAQLQRTRLKSARLSKEAMNLLSEIARANAGKLRFLRWAMYGKNQPQHVFHRLLSQEQERVWEALKSRPAEIEAMAA
ncbi:MAG: hypothetical protein AB7U82_12700 [Blastocatellales bacterium]